MKVVVFLVVLRLLASCTKVSEEPSPFRDENILLATTTRFEAREFAGTWFEVGAFTPDGTPKAGDIWAVSAISKDEFGLGIATESCGGLDCEIHTVDDPRDHQAKLTGHGQFDLIDIKFDKKASEVLLLWIDPDYRVAAIAFNGGKTASVFSRTKNIRSDLYTAATEVLDFNGYDLGKLERVDRWPGE